MNKTQLLADIQAKGGMITATELMETVGDVQSYRTNVFTPGEDHDSGAIAQKRNIYFYVYKEGTADETAYYRDSNWLNPEDRNIKGSSLANIAGIFSNQSLRERTKGAMIKAAFNILNEAVDTENHAGRLALARTIMVGVEAYIDAFMFLVASSPRVQNRGGAATDNDLENIVNSNWNRLI